MGRSIDDHRVWSLGVAYIASGIVLLAFLHFLFGSSDTDTSALPTYIVQGWVFVFLVAPVIGYSQHKHLELLRRHQIRNNEPAHSHRSGPESKPVIQGDLSTAILSSTTDAILILDPEYRVQSVNDVYERISGISREAVIGELVFEGAYPIEPDDVGKLRRSLTTENQWKGELVSFGQHGKSMFCKATITKLQAPNVRACGFVMTLADLSRFREYERKLTEAAFNDAVTGLPNRFAFQRKAEEVLGGANPIIENIALFLINIDHFQDVNESCGHAVGDACLKHLGDELRNRLGEETFVARHDGDSFLVLSAKLESSAASGLFARKILHLFDQSVRIDNFDIALTASVGVSLFPEDGKTIDSLMRNAESALAEAKSDGGDDYRYYTAGSEERAKQFIHKAAQIREGLKRGEFVAHYQPIICFETGRVRKFEVLARWKHPERGLLGPGEFIDVAERARLIGELSESLLAQSVEQLKCWDCINIPKVELSINLSARQFRDSQLAQRLYGIVLEAGIDPRRLIFEITESVMMHNVASRQRIIQDLKKCGFRIYIDDFGTGYSSLSYLRQFNVDGIKIDREFVSNLPHDPTSHTLVKGIIALAKALDLDVIAEGIETSEQARTLVNYGCTKLQGFLFSKPIASENVTSLLESNKVFQVDD